MLWVPCVCRSPQFYAFLKNNLVDAKLNLLRKKRIRVDAVLNPLRKKRIKVDVMPNSLPREINSLRNGCYALRLANIEYLDMIVAMRILFILFEYDQRWISKPQPFILIISIQSLISFHPQYLLRNFFLNIVYQSSWE